MAVANTIAAVQAGATQVQGTINGYGERCGNANLLSVIPNLQLKLGMDVISEEQLGHLTEVHRFTAELANMPRSRYQPYVGESAFTHKGGLHVSAVTKVEDSYQHVRPELVGNAKHVVVSELAGRSNIAVKLQEAGLTADVSGKRLSALLQLVKERENQGFQYEGAEGSFRLLVERTEPGYRPPFDLVDFMVVMEKRRRPGSRSGDDSLCEAMVKLSVNGDVRHTVAEGNGPVNALDQAIRKALLDFYPHLGDVELTDYKVRVVSQGPGGTGAVVRVLVESTNGEQTWATVGASTNIIEASVAGAVGQPRIRAAATLMPTEVFHMDANGVRISAQRAVFAEHTYAPRNIRSVDRVEDQGVRWPGRFTLFLGFAIIGAGFLLQYTLVVLVGAVGVMSGSLNLARKRSRYGIRITTQRGPVYVLASRDKRYVEVVADALLRAVSAAHRTREAAQDEPEDSPGEERSPDDHPPAPGSQAPSPRRGGRPTPRRRRR